MYNLKLSKLISFIVIISIFILVGLLGIYFDSLLKKNYMNDTKIRMEHGLTRLHVEIENIKDSLNKGLELVKDDRYFLSSLELINNYQDKNNYNAILLDEEKKSIAKQLLNRVKLSMNNDMAVYDKNYELIAYVIKRKKGYQLNFISYENSKKVLYSRYETQRVYKKRKFSEYDLMEFNHKSYYGLDEVRNKSVITYHFMHNKLYCKSHYTINKGNSLKDVAAHIEMSYLMGEKYLDKLSKDLNMDVSFSKDMYYMKDSINILDQGVHGDIRVLQTDKNYFVAPYIKTQDKYIFFVFKLDKTFLLNTLSDSRYKLLFIMLIVAIVIIFILQYTFSKRLYIPISKLMQQIKRVEDRDYSAFTELNSGDELGLISKNINQLAKTISTRESQLLESRSNLEHLSNHDTLTDTPNRRLFMWRLEHAIQNAKRNENKVAVIFLDLDQFKQINDTLGHDVGDELLKEVAKRLSTNIRTVDTLARIGGDEFNVLVENVKDISGLESIVTKLLDGFKEPFSCLNHSINITTSIGVSIYPDDGEDITTLIKNADLAMYKSKDKGRNSFSFFSEELADNIKNRMKIVNALKSAMDDFSEFEVFYQPKISMKTKKIIGVEALIRWNSRTLGFMSPDKFISLAEDTNLIIPLGEWIAKKAISDFIKLQEEGFELLQVSINISGKQLYHGDMVNTMKNIIKSTNIEPKFIELEITESYIATNEKKAIDLLRTFRAMGIDLAIDDFGTGYSSMNYLRHLPVSRLKIDKSFIDNIPKSQQNVAITKAIIILAKTFGLLITAEGVESLEQVKFLDNEGCDEIQGYFYSKPLNIDELREFLKR